MSGHRYTEYIVRDETGRDAYKADSDYLAVAWVRRNASQLTGRVRLVIRSTVEHTQYIDARATP